MDKYQNRMEYILAKGFMKQKVVGEYFKKHADQYIEQERENREDLKMGGLEQFYLQGSDQVQIKRELRNRIRVNKSIMDQINDPANYEPHIISEGMQMDSQQIVQKILRQQKDKRQLMSTRNEMITNKKNMVKDYKKKGLHVK